MTRARAFAGLGSNQGDPAAQIEHALAALEERGHRVAAVARCVSSPFEGAPDGTSPADVLNTVAEVRTSSDPHALLADLLAIEKEAGRVRDGNPSRVIDLDLLAYASLAIETPDLVLPHPRCTGRAFVMAPWMEIAPLYEVEGATVAEHYARRLDAADTMGRRDVPRLPHAGGPAEVFPDAGALRAWRDRQRGVVGVVMTMGALHAGHATLIRRARAECDVVLATIFVNPLQFDEAGDLAAYPKTLEADLEVLRANGADAVYVPRESDLYPDGFDDHIEPGPPAEGYEGAKRPGHFRGVVTVVNELWKRTRPDRAYFGRKDAQQAAVIKWLVEERRLPGEVVVCPTIRDPDGMAMSSRNRRLSADERARGLSLSRALDGMARAALGPPSDWLLVDRGRRVLDEARVEVEYLDVVHPDTMRPRDLVAGRPWLAIGAIRVGDTRLIDNRWVVHPTAES